jgi:intracellular sulfur oxidation DsrE/DsrF family protein
MNSKKQTSPRRAFLGNIAAGAAAIGLMSIPESIKSAPKLFSQSTLDDADEWFNKVKGKHRIVFDFSENKGLMTFAWPKVFLLTNAATGTPEEDCGVVVVLRHEAIPYAFEDRLWSKYKFEENFKLGSLGPGFQAADAKTAMKTRNPFLKTKPGDFAVPGMGPVDVSIGSLQKSGVMICVCNAAITVNSAAIAMGMNMDAAKVKEDWLAGVLPGIQVVPSGVWAVGRAQEHDCKYCS